jgi:hypothetical protein
MVSSLEPCAMAMMLIYFAGYRGEYASGQAWRSAHAFSYNGKQADVVIDVDWLQVAMGELDREVGLERLDGWFEIGLADQETEALPITRAAEQKNLHVRQGEGVQAAGHQPRATQRGIRGLH